MHTNKPNMLHISVNRLFWGSYEEIYWTNCISLTKFFFNFSQFCFFLILNFHIKSSQPFTLGQT